MIRCLSLISSQSLAIGIGITSPTETVDLRQTGWAMVPGNVGSLSGCDPPARRPAKGVGKGSGRVAASSKVFAVALGPGPSNWRNVLGLCSSPVDMIAMMLNGGEMPGQRSGDTASNV